MRGSRLPKDDWLSSVETIEFLPAEPVVLLTPEELDAATGATSS